MMDETNPLRPPAPEMIDDTNPLTPSAPVTPQGEHPTEPAAAPAAAPAAPAPQGFSPAVQKFKACRWRCDPEAGEFCTHRDVLPFAGKEGFVPDSWCPDCAYYKLRRTPKKRDYTQY